jgi:hypothetical protein
MKKDSSCLLHLLCVQPQLRGHDVLPQKGHLKIEIIEDIIPVYNITCAIRIPRKPVRIYSAVTGKEYPFKYENATVSFTVDEVYIHELVIIETDGKEARMK